MKITIEEFKKDGSKYMKMSRKQQIEVVAEDKTRMILDNRPVITGEDKKIELLSKALKRIMTACEAKSDQHPEIWEDAKKALKYEVWEYDERAGR